MFQDRFSLQYFFPRLSNQKLLYGILYDKITLYQGLSLKSIYFFQISGEIMPDKKMFLNINYDDWTEEEKKDFRKSAGENSKLTLYEGKVKHAYDVKSVDNIEVCPRCNARAEQHYANFIYATQIAPRVMFAPAGYFCTKCPTVIIDQDIIQIGVAKDFQYGGVLGISYDSRKMPDIFKTWNGETAIYILDKNQEMMGLTTSTEEPCRLQQSLNKK